MLVEYNVIYYMIQKFLRKQIIATEHSQVYMRIALIPPNLVIWTVLTAMSDLLTAMSN